MDATKSSAAFTVLEGFVPVRGLAVTPGQEWTSVAPGKEWASVECASKGAYGCGKVGQQLVDGLTLYVRPADHQDLTTSMAISLSDEAAERIAAELGFPRSNLQAEGDIKIAHRQVLVLLLMFRYNCIIRATYYLVYDSTKSSLYLIPYLPPEIEAIYTLAAVPDRSDAGVGLKLALMARKICFGKVNSGRLCICTPAAESDSTTPWQTKVHRFLTHGSSELCQPFSADVAFSFEGKIFWGDLSQGVAYSDLGKKDGVVLAKFIKLPNEYVIQDLQRDTVKMREKMMRDWTRVITLTVPAKMSRTMGCVKDSIKFVCVDCRPANGMVKVLTLDLKDKLWKEDERYSCSWDVLWEQVCCMNPELSGVEPLEPEYPVLLEDGTLFVLLPKVPNEESGRGGNYYICSFDMHSKSLQHFGLVHNYHTLSPVILPHDFFLKKKKNPPPPSLASILAADVQRCGS